MIREKKSFFERLTGIGSKDEEEKKEEVIETESGDEQSEIQEESSTAPTPPQKETGQEGQLTVDVFQTEDEIVIKSTIAGVKPENLDVTITNDMVTIRGERQHDETISQESYYYQECYWGSFSRSIVLPVDIISEEAVAKLKNGILTIHLPKADRVKTKKISVEEE